MPLKKVNTTNPPWFEAATEKADDDAPYRVRHVVPERYEAYAKILHPLYELPDVEDRELTWDEWERSRWEEEERQGTGTDSDFARLVREKTTTWIGATDGREDVRQVSWRTLTERYGMAYVPELSHWSFKVAFEKSWPRYLTGAQEGNLDPREAWALLECLRPHAEERCRFWFCWADTWSEKEDRTDAIAEGDLYDLPHAMVAGHADWPTAIWPLGENWFVGSDPDLSFTLIGGPRPLIDTVLADPRLETFEVSASMGISRYADTTNT